MNNPCGEPVKVVGGRMRRRKGPSAAEGFLDVVVTLRGDKPFNPKGIHRFSGFEESQAWSIRMMGRRRSPGRRA